MPSGGGPGGDVELLAVGTKVRAAAEKHDSHTFVEAEFAGFEPSEGREARITK